MRPAELKAMMRLGFVGEDADPVEAFLLWGRLLRDPVLWQARLALAPDSTVVPPLLDVLHKLMPVEVVALRQRLEAMEKVKRDEA
jgi:hypothetical protein